MPTYNFIHPETKAKISITGDTPPDEATLDQIFSETAGQAPAPQQSYDDFKKAFIADQATTGYKVKEGLKDFTRKAIPMVRPTIEGLGAVVGGGLGGGGGLLAGAPTVIGAPAGAIAGGLAGAGLGYSTAKTGLDTLEEYLGGSPEAQRLANRSMTERMLAPVKDAAMGTTFEMGGQIAPTVVKAVAGGQSALYKPLLGRMSGSGKAAVEEAIASGEKAWKGNPFKSKTPFDKAMRGQTSADEVVSNVRGALEDVKMQRSQAYQDKLAQVSANQQPIDMVPFKQRLSDLMDSYNVKINNGQVDTSRVPMGKKGRADIEDVVEMVSSWGSQAGDDTALGLDTLKRQLDDFYSESSQARQFVADIKAKVRDTITDHVPEYGEMTKGYSEATQLIKEMEQGLSLRNTGMIGRVTGDQTLRRLISSMKDNFQLRKELLDTLGKKANEDLSGQVAGLTMNSVMPSGLAGVGLTSAGMVGAQVAGGINPAYLGSFAASSPRVQAEFLRLLGKVKGASNAAPMKLKAGVPRQAAITMRGLMDKDDN